MDAKKNQAKHEKNKRRFEKRVAERKRERELLLFGMEEMQKVKAAEKERAALENWRSRTR